MIHFKSRKEKEKSNLGISLTNLSYTSGVFNLFKVNKFLAFSKVWLLLYYYSVNRRIWMYLLYVIFLLQVDSSDTNVSHHIAAKCLIYFLAREKIIC